MKAPGSRLRAPGQQVPGSGIQAPGQQSWQRQLKYRLLPVGREQAQRELLTSLGPLRGQLLDQVDIYETPYGYKAVAYDRETGGLTRKAVLFRCWIPNLWLFINSATIYGAIATIVLALRGDWWVVPVTTLLMVMTWPTIAVTGRVMAPKLSRKFLTLSPGQCWVGPHDEVLDLPRKRG